MGYPQIVYRSERFLKEPQQCTTTPHLCVVQNLQMLSLAEAQVLVRASIVVVQGDEYFGIRNLCLATVRYLWHGPHLLLRWGRRVGYTVGHDLVRTGLHLDARLDMLVWSAEAVAHLDGCAPDSMVSQPLATTLNKLLAD